MKKYVLPLILLCSLTAFSQSAKKLFKQATKEIEGKYYSDAETHITAALRLKPNTYKYYLTRAQVREKLNKPEEALVDYSTCLAMEKSNEKLMTKIADINISLKKYDEAIKMLYSLLAENEKNKDATIKLIECQIITKKFREAIASCDASFNKNYYNHQTHFYKAVALDSLGEYENAHKDYTTAITLMRNEGDNAKNPLPKFKPYFANIALVEHKLKRFDEAIKNYTNAINMDAKDSVMPKNYLVLYNRSNTFVEKTDYMNALGDLTKAIVLDEKQKESFFRRGLVNQLTKQFQSAISDYTKTIGLDPKHYLAIKNRAKCYMELSMWQEAIGDFTSASNLRANDNEVNEGLTYTKKKLYEQNRENDDPVITITYPIAETGTGFVNIFVNQQDVIVEGSIKDKSLIEKITVNNVSAVYKNEKDPSFSCRVPADKAQTLEIAATDVYGNTAKKSLKIGRILDDSKVKVMFTGRLLTDDGTNRPFTNKTVYLTNDKGEVLFTSKTDDKGKFVFRNIGYDKNYMLSMDAQDSPFSDVPGFRMIDENGNTIMKGVPNTSSKGKFRFEIIPTNYDVMNMMTIDDAPLMLDMAGKLVANNTEKTPIGNVKFLLLNERKEAVSFTNTEEDGHFVFRDLMPFDYEYSIDDVDAKKIPYEVILVTDEKGRILREIKKDGEGKFRFRLLQQERTFLSAIAISESDPWLSLDNMNSTKNEKLIIENIYYESGSFKILPEAEAILQKAIEALTKNQKLTMEIQSHTDAVAGDEYNMELSIKRANEVMNYLVTRGAIDKKRLTAKGLGESELTNHCTNGVDCSDAEHRQNRRTVFKLNYNEKTK